MKKNVGSLDRAARTIGAIAMLLGALFAPAPLHIAIRAGIAIMGVYLAFTALAGTCLGYKMVGRSTCPREHP